MTIRRLSIGALLIIPLLCACAAGDSDTARLHRAQRDFWRARHFQMRLDIYPDRSLAEASLDRYREFLVEHRAAELPNPLPRAEREGPKAKLVRVRAMVALTAAGIQRELGDREGAIARLSAACRPDLPLGSLVERKLHRTLSSHLLEIGESAAAIEALQALMDRLASGLDEGDAAYPDEELLALPSETLAIAAEASDSALADLTAAKATDFFERVVLFYPGGEAEYIALLAALDLALVHDEWRNAESALQRLSESFPDRDPWRADLRRARLLLEDLGRVEEGKALLRELTEAGGGRGEAAQNASLVLIRHLLQVEDLTAAEEEIRQLHMQLGRGELRAELLYLWGELEIRRGAWEDADARWQEAASGQPFTAYGMRSRFAIAEKWAERGEPRFAGRSLARLFAASRRNTRHRPGSALAGFGLRLESRGDSLLGTLPASESIVRQLQEQRAPQGGRL